MQKNKYIKVVCAMSGGVDSSVAAALLKRQGYDVVGVFLKLWKESGKNQSENSCCSKEAAESARKVAEKLDIPFYVLDASKEFKKEVVDYYISEYDAGRTPNPCVVCNKIIKFGWLLDKAKKLGADFVATGHYARLRRKFPNSKFQFPNKSQIQNNKLQIKLLKAKDRKKDQSYFLWQLDQKQLKHVLFPIGDYAKPEVRKLAKKFGLPVAEKKESQNVCFVPDGDNPAFLLKYAKKLLKPGDIVDLQGNILGRHKGLAYYTIGQRHGITANSKLKNQNSKIFCKYGKGRIPPIYVIRLNVEKNELVIGEEKDLYQKELIAEKVNWLTSFNPFILLLTAKIRYGHKEAKCKIIKINSKKIKVIFAKPQRAITPGQSIVFYRNNELIGGGIIN